jgi:hypothetical protein
MVKTPDANYQDTILEKKGMFSRVRGLFGSRKKDDPLTIKPQYTMEQLKAMQADLERKAQAEADHAARLQLKNIERQRRTAPVEVNADDGLFEPDQPQQTRTIRQQQVPQVIQQVVAQPTSRAAKFLNVAITAFAFVVGMVGVNIVYNQLPTYPMVTVGIVAIAISAGIVTNMAR